MGSIFSLDDAIDMLRRRAVVIAMVIVLGSVLSVLFALGQQHMYRSIEVIQFSQPKIADELARSTAEGSSARRLQLIEQRLMARDSVLEIIDKYDLYSQYRGLTQAELVLRLRQSVRVQGTAAAPSGGFDDGAVSILTISADMPTALQAQQVAHEISQRTIELTNESRIEQARETLAFFEARADTLRAEIARVDDEFAAYRNANEVSMPGSIEFRRSEIATINQGLLDIARERIEIERAAQNVSETERKATAERKLADFNEQLATLEAQRVLLADRKAELEASVETAPEVERRVGAYERELEQLQAELDNLAERRTEAEVGYRLETQAQSGRLTVLEPATIPDYPITGSRKKLALMGGVASVGLALLIAFLLDLRRPVIRSAAQMQREIGFRPVVSVPFLDTRPKRKWFGLGPKVKQKDEAVL
ncbi:GumC family protein [Phaeobacter marinintestinus]|uniref:GumC family protein n=1 Tax=Falsiphaeobacter marinintestinus TaxID=1492905 RepID=UPI0011B4B1B6|nr:DUF874 domain-containing protein [Phaeobacter marinintestinus]